MSVSETERRVWSLRYINQQGTGLGIAVRGEGCGASRYISRGQTVRRHLAYITSHSQ